MAMTSKWIVSLPPPIPVIGLSEEGITVCARAAGDDLRFEARRLAELTFEWSPRQIGLNWWLCLGDEHVAWISKRLEAHHRRLNSFTSADFGNAQWAGRHLRKRLSRLLRSALELAELAAFLHQFIEDSIAGLWAVRTALFVRYTGMHVLLVLEADGAERVRLLGSIREAHAEMVFLSSILTNVIDDWTDDPPGYDEIVESVLGESPEASLEEGASLREAFPGGPRRFVELGARQLHLIASTIRIPDKLAENYLGLGLKLGTSRMPILAHYTAALVGRLVMRAALVDGHRVGYLIADFNHKQAGRIQAAGKEYHRLLDAGADDPYSTALPDAYRTLTEGVLRPFGSLLVRLHQVADGENIGRFVAFGTLGELEHALAGRSDELIRLARLGLSKELRNYEAHEDVVRTGAGTLAAIEDDGTSIPLDPYVINTQLITLRSFLDGVDVAATVAFTGIAIYTRPYPTDIVQTEALLEGVARSLLAELTDGQLDSLRVREQAVLIRFRGRAAPNQLELFALALRRVLDPAVKGVRVVDAVSDAVLAELSWS